MAKYYNKNGEKSRLALEKGFCEVVEVNFSNGKWLKTLKYQNGGFYVRGTLKAQNLDHAIVWEQVFQKDELTKARKFFRELKEPVFRCDFKAHWNTSGCSRNFSAMSDSMTDRVVEFYGSIPAGLEIFSIRIAAY